jgi:HEAT repeat protein
MASSAQLAKILALLDRGTTEEAIAAAVVLGALAPREKKVVQSLARALEREGNLPLALAAARSLGRIGNAAALKALLPLLHAEGELRETGALAIAGCGRAAMGAVRKELAEADFHTRNVLLRILARMSTAESLGLVLETFFDPNFEVVKAAGRALRNEVPSLTPARRKAAAKTSLAFLRRKTVRSSRSATNSTLIYLGALAHPDAVMDLLGFSGPEETRSTRRHALNALRHTLLEATVPAPVVKTLFPYLDDADYVSVVEPALAILETAELPSRYEKELKRLVGGRYPAVRQFAVRKLSALGTKTSGQALLEVMNGKDEDLRRSAVRALKHSRQAPALLLPQLLTEKDPDRAWSLVHLVKPHASNLDLGQLKKLEKTSLKLLDRGDRVAEPLLHLFRHADEQGFSRTLYRRALLAKRARRYADAERDLRLISRSPHFDDDARFLLGLMILKAAGKDLSPTSPRCRQVLEGFRRMAEREDFDLESRIRKEGRTLGPEGLYAAGFGLIEGTGPTRVLGAKLLRAQVKKAPRTKVGRMARAKLETEGLA